MLNRATERKLHSSLFVLSIFFLPVVKFLGIWPRGGRPRARGSQVRRRGWHGAELVWRDCGWSVTEKDKALPRDRSTVGQSILRTLRCAISFGAVDAARDRAVAKRKKTKKTLFGAQRDARSAGPRFRWSLGGHIRSVSRSSWGNGAPKSLSARYRENQRFLSIRGRAWLRIETLCPSEARRVSDATGRVPVNGILSSLKLYELGAPAPAADVGGVGELVRAMAAMYVTLSLVLGMLDVRLCTDGGSTSRRLYNQHTLMESRSRISYRIHVRT